MRKRWIALGAVVGLGVVVHLPPVARMFAHDGSGGCPFGYGAAPRTASHHDGPSARSRPALGLALGKARADDVERWASDRGATCATQHGGALVECNAIADGALPVTTAWFRFDVDGALASVQTTRHAVAAAPVADVLASTQRELTEALGAPAVRSGDVASIGEGALRQASIEYRFADYRAVVRATNMRGGFLLTESYEAI